MPQPILRMESGFVDLPVRQQPDPAEAKSHAAALRARVEEMSKTGSSDQELRDATAAATQAGMVVDRAQLYFGKTSMPWPLQGIRIGDIALVATGGEPFSQIGVSIRKRSPFPYTLVSGYTNGGFGYIPTREAFPYGGYEVETTPFSEDAADVLIEHAVKLLTDLHK
jgi:neutral ceramidase